MFRIFIEVGGFQLVRNPIFFISYEEFYESFENTEILTKNFFSEHNTWEPAETVGTCKFLLEEFERNLAKQKEIKAQQLLLQNAKAAAAARNVASKTLLKSEASKAGPSSAAQTTCVINISIPLLLEQKFCLKEIILTKKKPPDYTFFCSFHDSCTFHRSM